MGHASGAAKASHRAAKAWPVGTVLTSLCMPWGCQGKPWGCQGMARGHRANLAVHAMGHAMGTTEASHGAVKASPVGTVLTSLCMPWGCQGKPWGVPWGCQGKPWGMPAGLSRHAMG